MNFFFKHTFNRDLLQINGSKCHFDYEQPYGLISVLPKLYVSEEMKSMLTFIRRLESRLLPKLIALMNRSI